MKVVKKFRRNRAKKKYVNEHGEIVPGVTSILDKTIPKPALIGASYKCGLRGIDYCKKWEHDALIGTLAHFMVQCYLRDWQPDVSEFPQCDIDKAMIPFEKFLQHWLHSRYKFVDSELELVSEHFGGTLDIIAENEQEELEYIDTKTSKAIYPEYWYQGGAYRWLYNSKVPAGGRLIKKVNIWRMGKKETGDFELQQRYNTDRELEIFFAALNLYEKLKA